MEWNGIKKKKNINNNKKVNVIIGHSSSPRARDSDNEFPYRTPINIIV